MIQILHPQNLTLIHLDHQIDLILLVSRVHLVRQIISLILQTHQVYQTISLILQVQVQVHVHQIRNLLLLVLQNHRDRRMIYLILLAQLLMMYPSYLSHNLNQLIQILHSLTKSLIPSLYPGQFLKTPVLFLLTLSNLHHLLILSGQ